MKKQVMASANFRAKSEGRSEALKASHKAAKGTFIGSKVVYTLKQQNRLHSNYKPEAKQKQEVVEELDIDFRMFN